MPIGFWKCQYCSFKDRSEQVVADHEYEHSKSMEVTKFHGKEEVPSTLSILDYETDDGNYMRFKLEWQASDTEKETPRQMSIVFGTDKNKFIDIIEHFLPTGDEDETQYGGTTDDPYDGTA